MTWAANRVFARLSGGERQRVLVARALTQQATAYCDHFVLLHAGRVVATGTPADVLTADRVAEVFGVRNTIVPHPTHTSSPRRPNNIGHVGQIVFVHGAWHGAWCWDGVTAELRQRDVAATAVELPLTGLAADVATARSAIEAAGPASVVVAHSYGGVVVSHAAAGLPNVTHLVHLAAYLTEPDEDMTMSGRLMNAIVVNDHGISVTPESAAALFYGDAPNDLAAELTGRLRPMTFAAWTPPSTPPAWQSVPTTYVVCTNDQAIPVTSQRRMATRADTVLEWQTDHSPFITRPEPSPTW